MRFFLIAFALWLLSQWQATAQAIAPSDSARLAWHRIPLSAEASIELPGIVTTKQMPDTAIKLFSARSQFVIYTVVAKKLTWRAQLVAELSPAILYQGVVRGSIGSLAHGRVVSSTPFELARQPGLEVQLVLPNQPNLAPARYLRVLYANGWLYLYSWRQLAVHTRTLPDDAAGRNSFFATFQLHRRFLTLPAAITTGWRAGRALFLVLGFFSLVLVGAMLLRRHHRA